MAQVDRLTLVELTDLLLTIGKFDDSASWREATNELADLSFRHVAKDVRTFNVIQVALEIHMHSLSTHNVGSWGQDKFVYFRYLLSEEDWREATFPTSRRNIMECIQHPLVDIDAKHLTTPLWQEQSRFIKGYEARCPVRYWEAVNDLVECIDHACNE
jgi:hypothetical protein